MSWLGRAIDSLVFDLSPQSGARRRAYRNAYEALSAGDRNTGFYAFDESAIDVSRGSNELAARARDMVRNNPWAIKAATIITNNTVGWGIFPRIKTEAVRAKFKRWAKDCQYGEPGSLYGIQRLAVLTEYQSGECLLVRRLTESGLKISLHEGRELDTSKNIGGDYAPGKPRIVDGVEFDGRGNRLAYWFKNGIVGDSVRVDASDVAHIFMRKRVGQVRGITDFTPVLVRLKEYDELEDALIRQQKVAACLGVFITDMDGVVDPKKLPPVPTTLTPGMIGHLAPGQQVQAVNPPASHAQTEQQKQALRAIAAGLGVTYCDLTGDFSAANFATMRADRLQHFASIRARQWQMLIPQGLDRLWRWWAEAYGYLDEPEPDWTTPPMPSVDPEKEGLAAQRDLRIGRMTFDEMIEEAGKDPDEHWREYAQNLEKLDQLGITLDSDPRKTSQNGIVQIQAQSA